MAESFLRGGKRITAGVVGLFMITGTGAALAYWTVSGTGAGEATTGESSPFVITTEPAVGILAPGNAGQTIAFTVDNPGTGAQYLTDVTVVIAGPGGMPWIPVAGCRPQDYAATMTMEPAAGDIAAGGSSTRGTVTVTLTDTGVDQNACQGQTVPLYFAAS